MYNTKLENLSNTKLLGDNRSISIPLKPKDDKIYIPLFKRNHKRKAYFARLDEGKSFDIDAKVFKPVSKPTTKLQKKYVFVPTCHLCGVVGHTRPKFCLLRQEPKPIRETSLEILMFLNLFMFATLWCLWSHSS